MSIVQNLPVDMNPITQQEKELISVLFPSIPIPSNIHNKNNENNVKQNNLHSRDLLLVFQEGLLIILLFLLFTLPISNQLVHKWLSNYCNPTIIFMLRISIILIIYWIVKSYILKITLS